MNKHNLIIQIIFHIVTIYKYKKINNLLKNYDGLTIRDKNKYTFVVKNKNKIENDHNILKYYAFYL